MSKTTFTKFHVRSIKGKVTAKIAWGDYALLVTKGNECSIEAKKAFSVAVRRYIRNKAILLLRFPPSYFKTKKPQEVRMGSGKGKPEFEVVVLKEGMIIAEIQGGDEITARAAFALGIVRMPKLGLKFIKKASNLG